MVACKGIVSPVAWTSKADEAKAGTFRVTLAWVLAHKIRVTPCGREKVKM